VAHDELIQLINNQNYTALNPELENTIMSEVHQPSAYTNNQNYTEGLGFVTSSMTKDATIMNTGHNTGQFPVKDFLNFLETIDATQIGLTQGNLSTGVTNSPTYNNIPDTTTHPFYTTTADNTTDPATTIDPGFESYYTVNPVYTMSSPSNKSISPPTTSTAYSTTSMVENVTLYSVEAQNPTGSNMPTMTIPTIQDPLSISSDYMIPVSNGITIPTAIAPQSPLYSDIPGASSSAIRYPNMDTNQSSRDLQRNEASYDPVSPGNPTGPAYSSNMVDIPQEQSGTGNYIGNKNLSKQDIMKPTKTIVKKNKETKKRNNKGPKPQPLEQLPPENLENVMRCRVYRKAKKDLLNKEEQELADLTDKHKELTKKKEMMERAVEKFQTAYIKLISEGKIKFNA